MMGPKSRILAKLKRFMCDLGPAIEGGVWVGGGLAAEEASEDR